MDHLESIDYVLELTRRTPTDFNVWLKLAQTYLRLKSLKESYAAASQAIRLAAHVEEVWLFRASLNIKSGDPSSAEDDYTQAIVLADVHGNKDLYYSTLKLRAYSRSLIGDFQGALDDLILVRKYMILDKRSLELYQYCTSMLETN